MLMENKTLKAQETSSVGLDKIKTTYVNPPVPSRSFDWVAFIDGREEDGPHGWGKTEQEAIADLKDLLADEAL